jgi:hypothetical protein
MSLSVSNTYDFKDVMEKRISYDNYLDWFARKNDADFQEFKKNATSYEDKKKCVAYEVYKAKVKQDDAVFQAMSPTYQNHNPMPFSEFKFEICVLCNEMICDDPFGHNPYPVKQSGRCCSKCNHYVVAYRLKEVFGDEAEASDNDE